MTPVPARGFSLIEMAVVMAIFALLLGSVLLPLSGQQEAHKRRETERALGVAREALLGFAVINGRLPCPAAPTQPAGSGGACPDGGAAAVAGCEATTGTGSSLACAAAEGVLPWATLGLPQTDAWGRRYGYRVATLFARGIDPAQAEFGGPACPLNPADHHTYNPALGDGPRQAAFAICTPGDIAVLAAAGGTSLAANVPAVIVSHGRNGAGAYTEEGSRIAPAASGDEAENADGNASFVSSAAIDDLVLWLPASLLVSRMMSAGKLP